MIEEAAVDDAAEWAEPADESDGENSGIGGLGMVAGTGAAATAGFVAADVIADSGPVTEPIPVVGTEVDSDGVEEIALDETGGVEEIEELDAESSELFGTEMESAEAAEEMDVEGSVEAGSFAKRFAESLDVTPILRK